jgi:ABC-type multidrug transport system fused ATPase/permease subunit
MASIVRPQADIQNSIERIKRYAELDQEALANKPTDPPTEQWPTVGAVSFKGVEPKYRPELPLVLKGLDFEVRPGEKLGIIGRTGAGKSSLVQAIYRTVELAGGEIKIDGINHQSLGLDTVRRAAFWVPADL